MNKTTLQKLVDKGLSTHKIAETLNMSQTNIRYWLNKHKLVTTQTINRKTEHKVKKCKYCGDNIPYNVHYRAKFCKRECVDKYLLEKRYNKYDKLEDLGILSVNSRRNYLIYRNGRKCTICGINHWNNKELPVIMDHINGNPSDNKRTNLRIICPNCDAQLPTYTGRNRGNGRNLGIEQYKTKPRLKR